MSRRYGRNQKRRAREALAAAQEGLNAMRGERDGFEQAYRMADGIGDSLGKQVRKLQAEVEEAKEYLHEFSAALPAQSMKMGGPARRIQLTAPDRYQFEIGVQAMEAVTMTLPETLYMLETRTEISRLDGHVHVNVEFADGSWAYMASRQAIHTMPRQRLIDEITQSLAKKIVADLRGKGGR